MARTEGSLKTSASLRLGARPFRMLQAGLHVTLARLQINSVHEGQRF
jgi:hypothetical protein